MPAGAAAVLLVLCMVAPAAADPRVVVVRPTSRSGDGDLKLAMGGAAVVGSVHEARLAVRRLLATEPSSSVEVQLLPGVHHVGSSPLVLGPLDGAVDGGSVTWKSADESTPASLVSSLEPAASPSIDASRIGDLIPV
jgi:hypothetical protein